MKRTLTAAIAAVVLAACILIPVSADDSSAASSYVSGYVCQTSTTGVNVALDGATVYLVTYSDSEVTLVGSYTTGSEDDQNSGWFYIAIDDASATNYYLGVYCDGYSLSTAPATYFTYSSTVPYTDSTTGTSITCYKMTLPSTYTVGDGDDRNYYYMVTEDITSANATGMNTILMMPVTVSLTITVTYGTNFIEDAKVTVTNEETDVSYTGKTDEYGVFTVDEIEYGNYSVKIEADGFEDYDAEITISQTVSSYSYNLTEKEHATYLFGLDLAHTFMICGVIFGVIIALIALAIYRKGNKIEE
jgi:hypothetical protein